MLIKKHALCYYYENEVLLVSRGDQVTNTLILFQVAFLWVYKFLFLGHMHYYLDQLVQARNVSAVVPSDLF